MLFRSIPITGLIMGVIYAYGVSTPFDWLLIILYNVSIIPFTYAVSLLFQSETMAQNITVLIHFFTGIGIAITILILRTQESTRDIVKALAWVFRIIPTFAVSDGIANISYREVYSILEKIERQSPMDFDIAGGDVLYLSALIPISFLILLLVESGCLSCITNCCGTPKIHNKLSTLETNALVSSEERNCESINLNINPPAILTKHLTKVFKLSSKITKTAISDITFSLNKGECLAFLGPTGAGKSTLFKMMTQHIDMSSGNIYVNGMDLSNNFSKIRKLIGYGPQYESSYMCLTVKENLEFYAKIKGIPSRIRSRLIDKLIDDMDLREYENVQIGNLSGGNKRKSTVAIALLGNPPIVLLDEPSTGVDPQSKRFMWKVIQRITAMNKNLAVIFSTHSMEEAEYLCNRMAIIVEGNLCTIGTPEELIETYGAGYEIQVSIPIPTKEEGEEYLKKFNIASDSNMNYQEIVNLFIEANRPDLKNQLELKGTASHIMTELNIRKFVKAKVIGDYLLIEEGGMRIAQELSEEFGEVIIADHIGNFFKFKVNNTKPNHTIGFIFGLLYDIVEKYKITQYSASHQLNTYVC